MSGFEIVVEQPESELVLDEGVLEIISEAEQGPPGKDSTVPGPQGVEGPKGDKGDIGPQGLPGISQSLPVIIPVPAQIWTINHNLGAFPSVTTVDTQGNVMYGDVSYPSNNQIRIEFLADVAGTAYLN